MKIVFADTNKLFRAFCYRKQDPYRLYSSWIFEYTNTVSYEFIISDFVISELERIYIRKVWYTTKNEIEEFFNDLWFEIYTVDGDEDVFLRYVQDIADANIVMGAQATKADYIRTDNLKDFNIDLIYMDFWIQVISKLP